MKENVWFSYASCGAIGAETSKCDKNIFQHVRPAVDTEIGVYMQCERICLVFILFWEM